MTPQDSIRFAALRGSMSEADKEAFRLALLADHDAIVRYDWLKDNLPHLPKEKAREIFNKLKLEAEGGKYPPAVVREDDLYGRPFYGLRAKLEIFRGLKRDADGKLRMPPEFRKGEIDRMIAKAHAQIGKGRNLFGETWGDDVEMLKAGIANHQAYIDGTKQNRGTVWDLVHGTVPVVDPEILAKLKADMAAASPTPATAQE
jgi:hypothetical protein